MMKMKNLLLILLLGATPGMSGDDNGIIGELTENGVSVIYNFVNELPGKSILEEFPILVVVKWEYDGSDYNGMPNKSIQEKLYQLDDELDEIAELGAGYRAYSRTGNNIREYVYYTVDKPI